MRLNTEKLKSDFNRAKAVNLVSFKESDEDIEKKSRYMCL